jgi:hypothetical protein
MVMFLFMCRIWWVGLRNSFLSSASGLQRHCAVSGSQSQTCQRVPRQNSTTLIITCCSYLPQIFFAFDVKDYFKFSDVWQTEE